MEEKDFKLPSKEAVEKVKEAEANKTVLIESTAPCMVNGNYYVAGVKFYCDKTQADDLVASKVATIIG